MENVPSGPVGYKLDLKNAADYVVVFNEISDPDPGTRGIKRRTMNTSRIPVPLKRIGVNGLRNQISSKSKPRRSKCSGQTSVANRSDIDKTASDAKEESTIGRQLDEDIIKISVDGGTAKDHNDVSVKVATTDSENSNYCYWSDAGGSECVSRKRSGPLKVVATNRGDVDTDLPLKAAKNMTSNEAAPATPCNIDLISTATNNNNNSLDYIEMLTLDANEFLTTSCVCKLPTYLTNNNFCKDCFSHNNYKVNTLNGHIGSSDDGNDVSIIKSCELKCTDNGLVNEENSPIIKKQKNDGDETIDCRNQADTTSENNNVLIEVNESSVKEKVDIEENNISSSSTAINLDLESVLQHQQQESEEEYIVNPAGPNSSRMLPSSDHQQQQQLSAYGESCASHESIETNDEERRRGEQAPIGSSRESDVDVVVDDAPGRRVSQDPHPAAGASVNHFLTETHGDTCSSPSKQQGNAISNVPCVATKEQLTWGFKNGRLVFAESKSNLDSSQEQVVCADSERDLISGSDKLDTSCDEPTLNNILCSKHINKRSDDTHSRLKYLEDKLKKAGITDANNKSPCNNNHLTTSCNCNQYLPTTNNDESNLSSLKLIDYKEFQKESSDKEQDKVERDKENSIEGEDLIPDGSHDFCQFNVSDFSEFSAFNTNRGVYDEFLKDSSSEESCECDDDEHFIVIRRMRGDGLAMVNDASSERSKHNPDRDNLKSLLKKSGRAKDKKSNRVVFNENKNEFFDADYIILIREDCELDDDDDDGICTCQQHEMVRLTCCEPNCNCQYDGSMEPTPQSPKFAPPMEFVDAVTLSPPEGYKDMEMMAVARGQQRGAVCRECSATHEEEIDEGEASPSDNEMDGQMREQEEREKTDQSQQTTPTTPPSSDNNSTNKNYIVDTLVASRQVQQQQIARELEEHRRSLHESQGSPISGILKGGRLWKQQGNNELSIIKGGDSNLVSSDSVTSDEEGNNRRSVRFIESDPNNEKRDICDGAPESSPEEVPTSQKEPIVMNESSSLYNKPPTETYIGGSSPDGTEMMLTFKLGNHVLISNNSLKPNSAVRQLFPCTKSLATAQGVPEEDNSQQYLVTAESLRAFEEAKRSKLPQIIQSGETDETIKRAIERNTLRRSLIRYEPRAKKQPYKSDNSLVERIKQLTCDVDDNTTDPNQLQSSIESSGGDLSEDVLDSRSSPPGEESMNPSTTDVNTLSASKTQDKTFSPSSSSTASSNSSMSINQNYQQVPTRKISAAGDHQGLIAIPDIQNNFRREFKPLPDIGGPHNHDPSEPPRAMANPPDLNHCILSNKMSSSSNTSESRRQFLSTLAPLTACVTMGVAHNEDYYYHLSNNVHHNHPGERISVASSGTEYSLEDIDEGLKTEDEEQKRIAPDVLAGTPSASESGDELAMFVQQDAGRMERIKKKYQPTEQKDNKNNDEDDEHDDYGFNRRPSVRGIKPRFGTTTEILQQIQNQLQPPAPPSARVAWPYYSESGLTTDNSKQKNANVSSNYHYINVGGEEVKTRGYAPQFRPTSLQEESLYQNCANERCASRDIYQRANANNVYQGVIRMGNDYYQSLPLNKQRNGRPQSPPPMDMSKQYHQTMVYIPYNHIEGYQPVQYYHQSNSSEYVARVSSQNQINKRYAEPIYQSRIHHHLEEHHYSPSMIPPVPPKVMNRVPYPNGQPPPHMMGGSRSDSPLQGQFSTARSTQTPAPAMSTCGYYPTNPRYRPVIDPVWQGEGNYATKVMNRHSFPNMGPPRYPPADSISLTDSDSQHSGSLPNGYRQSDISIYALKDSPTKPRFIERGVPEGAASVSPQDVSGVSQSSSSTMTSPTSPQNPPVPTNQKAMFYAMNV